MTPMMVELDPDTHARVKHLAEAQRRTTEGVLREAVAQYAEREDARARWTQHVHAAWDEYQATGLHVTGDEVDAWLARLEAGEDAEPPACHT